MSRRLPALIAAAILSAAASTAPAQARTDGSLRLLARPALAGRVSFNARPSLSRRWSFTARPSLAGVFDTTGGLSSQGATIGVLPSVRVGNLPQDAAFDPATDTVYVANQNDNTVSVVDARHCHAADTGGCGQTPVSVAVGAGPFAIAVDDRTHTVYVVNQNDNTVSVIDSKTCNGHDSAGCGLPARTVASGPTPFGIAVDPATDTLYVADGGGAGDTVSVINGAICNATDTAGCGQQPATAITGNLPFLILVDPHDDTVYVTNAADDTVSMIDRRTCNATDTRGCGHKAPTVAVGSFPLPLALDNRTGTLYVGSQNFANANREAPGSGPTIYVINAHTCNARHTTSCARPHPVLTVEGGTDGMSMDERTDTLFVANNGPGSSPSQANSVSVIDAATCNARTTSGCGQHAPTALTGANPGGNTLDPSTDTEYVTTFDNTLQVIDGARCHAGDLTGCGQPDPATDAGPGAFSIAVNPSTSSVYVGDFGGFPGAAWSISVLNAATCNTVDSAGCLATPANFSRPAVAFSLTADPATDTLYTSDSFVDSNFDLGDTVSAIDGAACNATTTSGCGAMPAAVTIPAGALATAEDLATHTLYVADNSTQTVSVVDASTCNAINPSGCGESPAQIPLGAFPLSVAVDQTTDTIYALNPGTPSTVSVIDGATCNATNTSGCGHVPPTVTVGNADNLEGIAVDEATDSVYVVNTADDTVSVIDGATCNASVTWGCSQTPTTVTVGHQGFSSVAVDQTTNRVYLTNGLDDTVSVIDGNTCNGKVTATCAEAQPAVPAGASPANLAVNANDGTVYVVDNGGDAATFFRFVIPERPTGVTASASHRSATVTWKRTYDGGLPIIYDVIPSPACRACTGLTTPSTSGAPATLVTGLTHGQTYTFRVRGTDAAGNGAASAPSNPVTP